MTQGKTIKELTENIKDAYALMVLDDVPQVIRQKKSLYEAEGINPPTYRGRVLFTQAWYKA